MRTEASGVHYRTLATKIFWGVALWAPTSWELGGDDSGMGHGLRALASLNSAHGATWPEEL